MVDNGYEIGATPLKYLQWLLHMSSNSTHATTCIMQYCSLSIALCNEYNFINTQCKTIECTISNNVMHACVIVYICMQYAHMYILG